MKLRFLNWIWHIKGSLPLAPALSSKEAFDRLDPLFREKGTSHERTADTLTFRKTDQAAQDRMSIFDGGTLTVEKGATGSVLRYHMTSRTLLFCFLAPLLFLGFAESIKLVLVPRTEAAAKAGKGPAAAKKPARLDAGIAMNPIDKFLGAPAPPPKTPAKKGAAGGGGDEEGGGRRKLSVTPAYVFAGIFAILYVVGRILEDRLVRSLFRKRLLGS